MSSDPPPIKQPGPLSFQRYGCLIVLVVLATIIIGGLFATWHVLVRTAVPLRKIAQWIEASNPNIKITGVSGNFTTGPSADLITWGDDPAQRSEIAGLRIKYNGYSDFRKTKRLVLTDVGVRKARIDLADFEDFAKEVRGSSSSGSSSGSSTSSSSSGSSTSPLTEMGLDSFEINQVLFEDVLITNRNSDFRLSIPRILWTGFKATPNDMDLGAFLVESDRLTLHTIPAIESPAGGSPAKSPRTLAGTVQPLMHPAIRKAISFKVSYAFVPEKDSLWYQARTDDDKVQLEKAEGGGDALHVRKLDLAEFLDATKLYGKEAADLPSDLVLEVTRTADEKDTQILSGSFKLGVTTFQIQAEKIAGPDDDAAEVVAVAGSGAEEIRWTLPLKGFPEQYLPSLRSAVDLPPKEILARVFAGKSYAELTAEEKQAVDARLPVYFAKPEP